MTKDEHIPLSIDDMKSILEEIDLERLDESEWTYQDGMFKHAYDDKEYTVRPSWEEYFLRIAQIVATRATCDRKHVGYVIVKGTQILSTGYNGSIVGEPHCDDVGHLIEGGHCLRTVHSEINAIAQAAKKGISVEGATMYGTWGVPCWNCFKTIANAGIKRIVFLEKTIDTKSQYEKQYSLVEETAKSAGIELIYHPLR